MILTTERIVLAIAAFGVFMLIQSKQRKAADRYLQNFQQRQRDDLMRDAPPEPMDSVEWNERRDSRFSPEGTEQPVAHEPGYQAEPDEERRLGPEPEPQPESEPGSLVQHLSSISSEREASQRQDSDLT